MSLSPPAQCHDRPPLIHRALSPGRQTERSPKVTVCVCVWSHKIRAVTGHSVCVCSPGSRVDTAALTRTPGRSFPHHQQRCRSVPSCSCFSTPPGSGSSCSAPERGGAEGAAAAGSSQLERGAPGHRSEGPGHILRIPQRPEGGREAATWLQSVTPETHLDGQTASGFSLGQTGQQDHFFFFF